MVVIGEGDGCAAASLALVPKKRRRCDVRPAGFDKLPGEIEGIRASDLIEADLLALLPDHLWTDFTHRLTWLGRRVCMARKPRCEQCRLKPDCPTGAAW